MTEDRRAMLGLIPSSGRTPATTADSTVQAPCALARSLLLKELSLLWTERIRILLARSLIGHDIFSILLQYIFSDCRFVQAYHADAMLHTPESPIAIPVFHWEISSKNHQRTFIFYSITDDVAYFSGIMTSICI